MSRFAGQTAVITGASSGMGRSLAAALATEGASLCLVGRDEKKLAAAIQSMGALARNARAVRCDLSVATDIQRLVEEIASHLKRVDILIHSAGAFRMGSFETLPADDVDELYRTNVRAPYTLTQALLLGLKQSKGQVVFINSTAGLNANANWGAYSATKAALKMLADSLRAEINAEGVRVLSVFPGRTASAMQESIHKMEKKTYRPELLIQPEDVASTVLNALALPRTAEVTDLFIRPMIKSG